MCGIAGILNFDGAPVNRDTLRKMTDVIAHRGPDSAGHWYSGGVGLGHRRLSIIDLSSEADQPMVSTDGKIVIVFNGEIYNYRELANELEAKGMRCRTHSDTEVILNLYRLYGVDCLAFLRGMFAFAIWDGVQNRLFVARDRVGIKPFYYLLSQKAFIFGSEIKAVAASGHSRLNVDMNAVSGFLRFLVVPQPDTIFDDIRKLEPGHYLVITGGGVVSENVYWIPPQPLAHPFSQAEEEEIVSSLDEALNNSVRYHMIADVPVSAFLSGGLDSSTVVSLMRAQAPNQEIDAFSITFPGQDEYDEDKYAREVARLKGISYHADTINASFIDDLELMAWHLDEPFAVSSAYATFYLAKNAARKAKVVLTGDGGDELFAGYQGYSNNAYQNNALISPILAAGYQISYALVKYTGLNHSALNRLLTGLRRRSGSEGLRYSEQVAQSSLLAASIVLNQDVFLRCLKVWEENLMAHYYNELPAADKLQKKLYAEFKTRLVDEMLMKVDRTTMAHSLEARVPLLDHHIVEFAFQQPSEMKLRASPQGPVSKYILKKAMERYLPFEIIYRPKQGFDIPVRNWLENGLLPTVREKILDGNLCKWGLVEKAGVEKLINLHADAVHNFTGMLMILLAFESWIDAYQARIGTVSVN
jgi:asparagine synthase (glutamine-hydrolysing)